MTVETTTSIAGLDATNPSGAAKKAEGDDHLRLLKNVLQHCFGGFGGEVMLAATEAQGATANDFVLTVSPAPTAYARSTIAIFSATHANSGAATIKIGALAAVSLLNPEGTALRANAITSGCWIAAAFDGTNFRLLAGGNSQAIYDYVDQAQFQSALPSQASNAGKFLKTDGTNATWQAALQQVTVAPASNQGPIYLAGSGAFEWNGSAYAQVYSKSSIGLGSVDNTSDANKPISTATQTALNTKANLSGANFSGAITATIVASAGVVQAGGGAAGLGANGDIGGPVWGGSLANYLSAQLNTKQPAGSYAGRSYNGTLSFGWNGLSLTGNVDGVGVGVLWTTANFDPNTKQAAGNYVSSRDGNVISLVWQPGTSKSLGVYINGTKVGEMSVV